MNENLRIRICKAIDRVDTLSVSEGDKAKCITIFNAAVARLEIEEDRLKEAIRIVGEMSIERVTVEEYDALQYLLNTCHNILEEKGG